MTALIIDDERLARAELRRLLKVHPDIEVVGEAADADEALGKITQLDPALLFLDIQMPGKSGFDLIKDLSPLPKVIFTTAFDEYAVKAFEFAAFDYLLKPIEPSRLARSIQRLQRETGPARAELPLSSGRDMLNEDDQVFVRNDDKCLFVKVGDIRMFESEGNYVRIHYAKQTVLIYRSLNQIEDRLNPAFFFRASRTHIINLRQIESVEDSFDSLVARLAGGISVRMSRRQSQAFRQRLAF